MDGNFTSPLTKSRHFLDLAGSARKQPQIDQVVQHCSSRVRDRNGFAGATKEAIDAHHLARDGT